VIIILRYKALYLRLSDEDRIKKNMSDESESIQNQKLMLIGFCVENGWSNYKIYCDEDYSGADRYRPDFNRMIKDCEEGLIDVVICKTQSRFSRDMEIVEKYIHGKFLEWNIRFIGLVDHADTSIIGNKKARQINGLVNEWYLEDLSDNIKRTLKIKHRNGQYTGSFAPYGYLIDPIDKNHLVIDPIASEVVKDIFNMYIHGMGYIKIAKELNARGIVSPTTHKQMSGSKYCNAQYARGTVRSKLWTDSTIYRILRREIYTGTLVQEKSENISYKNKKRRYKPESQWLKVPNTHDPIIDMETWNKVLELRKRKGRCDKFSGEMYSLSKKVYCKECKSTMWKMSYQLAHGRYKYLRCRTVKISADKCLNTSSVKLDYLENIVLTEINNLLENFYNPKLIKIDKRSNLDDKKIGLETEKQELLATKSKKESYMVKIYEDRLEGIITEEQFKMYNSKFSQELESVNYRLETINNELKALGEKDNVNKNFEKVLKKYKKISELSREVVDEFIEAIYVGKADENGQRVIDIQWKF